MTQPHDTDERMPDHAGEPAAARERMADYDGAPAGSGERALGNEGAPVSRERTPGNEGGPSGTDEHMPDYKGEPLDAERGPGLGCFWIQVGLLVALLVLTPISVVMAAPPWLSATLLIAALAVLFFVGQTSIFLLRLVAADRRTRRVPRGSAARRTVGQLEDEVRLSEASDVRGTEPSDEDHPGPR